VRWEIINPTIYKDCRRIEPSTPRASLRKKMSSDAQSGEFLQEEGLVVGPVLVLGTVPGEE